MVGVIPIAIGIQRTVQDPCHYGSPVILHDTA